MAHKAEANSSFISMKQLGKIETFTKIPKTKVKHDYIIPPPQYWILHNFMFRDREFPLGVYYASQTLQV